MKRVFDSSQFVLCVLFFVIAAVVKVCASDYNISFTASGVSNTLDYVVVQNLTRGTTVTVPAGNYLHVSDATGLNQLNAQDENVFVYSTASGKNVLSFYAKKAGISRINAFGVDGRKVAEINQFIPEGRNSFQLTLPNGVYIIQVVGIGYSYSTKTVSRQRLLTKISIDYNGYEKPTALGLQKSKSTSNVTTMFGSQGDRMLYKAVSGGYSTILTNAINSNQNIIFDFVACQDADLNNYTTVTIGTQTWMAENLKTTKYRNGEVIPNIPENNLWIALTTGAWRDYNNNATNSDKYGHLYNWFVVSNPLNIAPQGWHVPTDSEFTKLADYLGGSSVAGDKLKSTTNWYSYTPGTSNESGFTALAGGACDGTGAFNGLEQTGLWWTSSQSSDIFSWDWELTCNSAEFKRTYGSFIDGFSVRCIKDATIPTLYTTVSTVKENCILSGGVITSVGGSAITEFGVCWSISNNPTITDNKLVSGTSNTDPATTYTSFVTGLSDSTIYHIRAYATNGVGTAYGNDIIFRTSKFNQAKVFQKIYSTLGLTGNMQPSGDPDMQNVDEVNTSFVRLIWNLNELPTDEAMCSWSDVGLPEFNLNIWDPTFEQFNGLYKRLYFNVILCNHFLVLTANMTDVNSVKQRAEARFIRALNYYYLLDMFGNVPFTEAEIAFKSAPQTQRSTLFTYLNKELAACESDMFTPRASDKSYYRVDQAANWLLRSRLYLNAEVYTGTARWDSAAIFSKKVISSGYTLCPVFKQLFMADNAGVFDGSTVNQAPNEIILPIYADGINAQSWGSSLYLIASTHITGMNNWGSIEGWGGNRARSTLVKKFFPSGTTFFSDASDLTTAILPSLKDSRALFDKKSVCLSLEITTQSVFKQGCQVIKFTNVRADGGVTHDSRHTDTDVPFMRAAEAYLNYAEAVTRGATPIGGYGALEAVNALRTRAGAQLFSTLTLQNIIDERAREFFFEGYRRTDLIRFGQFGGNTNYLWDWKGGASTGTYFAPYLNVFPIPQSEIDANLNLSQNPGY